MSVKHVKSPTQPQQNKVERDSEDDDWWSQLTDWVTDYSDDNNVRHLSTDITWRLIVPVLLLCQAVTSLVNVICAIAFIEVAFQYESKELDLTSIFWLVISLTNTAFSIMMLGCFRLENPIIMRIFSAACCFILIALLISIFQAIIMLTNHYIGEPKYRKSKITVNGLLLGIIIRVVNTVITAIVMYLVHEFCTLVEKREKTRSNKKSENANKISLEQSTAEHSSPWLKV